MGLPARSSALRISPAYLASSSPNSSTRTGPPRKTFKRCAFASARALLPTPYQSSYSDTEDTQISAPDSTAFENRSRTLSEARLISTMHALVSSRYSIARFSIETLAPLRAWLLSAHLQQWLALQPVHRRKPFLEIRNHWFQQNTLGDPAHAHSIALEAEFARQAHRLAAPIPKQ